MSKYILVDEYLDTKQPKYFQQMTGIGPMSTANKAEAMVFDTEEEAKQSPAHRHWSANWRIEELKPVTPKPEGKGINLPKSDYVKLANEVSEIVDKEKA